MPDVFSGEPVPVEILKADNSLSDFDFHAWRGKHTDEITLSILEKVINALKADGVTSIGATGYCFGGRFIRYCLS